MKRHDVIVIAGGQAGLAMSSILRGRGREHVVLERHRVAERWRTERWDSLKFQFPNWSLQLPGVGYRGGAGRFRLPGAGPAVLDNRGRPVQHRGVTAVSGAYFPGLHWMHAFESGTVFGVGRDAEYLADVMDQAR